MNDPEECGICRPRVRLEGWKSGKDECTTFARVGLDGSSRIKPFYILDRELQILRFKSSWFPGWLVTWILVNGVMTQRNSSQFCVTMPVWNWRYTTKFDHNSSI